MALRFRLGAVAAAIRQAHKTSTASTALSGMSSSSSALDTPPVLTKVKGIRIPMLISILGLPLLKHPFSGKMHYTFPFAGVWRLLRAVHPSFVKTAEIIFRKMDVFNRPYPPPSNLREGVTAYVRSEYNSFKLRVSFLERRMTCFYGVLVGPLVVGLSLGFYTHESKVEDAKYRLKCLEHRHKLRGISYHAAEKPTGSTTARNITSTVKNFCSKVIGLIWPGTSNDSQVQENGPRKGSVLAVDKFVQVQENGPRKGPDLTEPLSSKIDIKTAPADIRFPGTNQSKHCFTRYVEYHRCLKAKGNNTADCEKFASYYRSLCPGEWVDKWNEQRKNGTFPGPL